MREKAQEPQFAKVVAIALAWPGLLLAQEVLAALGNTLLGKRIGAERRRVQHQEQAV